MIIYLDETYDHNHTWLLLGALFNPTHNKFHRQIKGILARNAYVLPNGQFKEIKYNRCSFSKAFKIYKEVVDAFMQSDSRFSSIAVRTDDTFDLEIYGRPDEPAKLKKERAYRSLTEELLKRNLVHMSNAILFLDKMTRCEPETFMEILKRNFSTVGAGYSQDSKHPKIRHIQDVVSGAEGYELMGVCDLLQGCILNNLLPILPSGPKRKGSLYKNKIREYLVSKLGVRDLLPETWKADEIGGMEIYKKFNIHYVVQAKRSEEAKPGFPK